MEKVKKIKILTLVLLAIAMVSVYFSHVSKAQIPNYLGYQGRLKDSANAPLNGNYSFTFRIYDALVAGNLLWSETQNVSVSDGYFSVSLGAVNPLNLTFEKPYWLSNEVAADGEMSPRVQINSVGYSYSADKAYSAENLAAAPAGTLGRMYYNTTDNNMYFYNGAWTNFSGANYWSQSGTDLSPSTAGDDILLHNNEDLTMQSMTLGSVLFAGTGGLVSQDNSNLFWDDTNKFLGIGSNIPSEKLFVNGNGVIKNHMAIGNDSGIDKDYPLGGTQSSIMDVRENVTDLSSKSIVNANYVSLNLNPAAPVTSAVYGVNFELYTDSANIQDYGTLNAAWNSVSHQGTGTVSQIYGVQNYLSNNDGVISGAFSTYDGLVNRAGGLVTDYYGNYLTYSNFAGGTITNAYLLYVSQGLNLGTVTNNYGLYLEDQTVGTNNYAIYSAGGQSYFAGNIGLGILSPTQKLDVNGNIRIANQGDLILADLDSSNYVAFQAPAAVGANVTWTMPAADGTVGQVLSTNGAGVLSFSSESDPVWVAAEPNYGNLGQVETISGNWVNTANPWEDNEVSDTLTSSLFVGAGSTTTAVDLATAEVSGILTTNKGGLGIDTSGAAQGDILYYDGTNWARLAPGASGQFLKTQGAAANPVWASESAETDPVWTLAEPNYGNLGQAETLSANWVNTANPWADNEVADNLTISGGTIDNTIIGGTTAAAGTFTNIISTGNINIGGTWDIGGTAVTASASELNTLSGLSGTIWTSSNDGPGSGLNADLLDGINSAVFLTFESDPVWIADEPNYANLGQAETITGNWVNTASPWADNEVSDTLTSSLFVGTGSTTTAVDLATAEVSGILTTNKGGLGIDTSGAAQGDILYYNGTNWARLSPGTSGQFLQTQGVAANPIWAAGGGAVGADSLDYTEFKDSMALDATTTTALGVNNNIYNLNSTGDFILQDNGSAFLTFNDDRSLVYDSNLTATNSFTINANSQTTATAMTLNANALTTGTGLYVYSNSASYTNNIFGLVDFRLANIASTGNLLVVTNSANSNAQKITETNGTANSTKTGAALYIEITQDSRNGYGFYMDTVESGSETKVFGIETSNTTGGQAADTEHFYVRADGVAKVYASATSAPTRNADGEYGFYDAGGPDTNMRLYFRVNGTNRYINSSGAGDYSEYFKKEKEIELNPGEIVSLNKELPNGVKKTTLAKDKNILGVVSAQGTRNNDDQEDGMRHKDPSFVNIGMLGQLPVLVNLENGPIKIGDYITSSNEAGVGMKAELGDPTVGIALESYDKEGTGKIQLLMSVNNGSNVGSGIINTASSETTTEAAPEQTIFSGRAEVMAGNSSVRVIFAKALASEPIVSLTPRGNIGLNYWVSDESTQGFTINLSSQAILNSGFNWQAVLGDTQIKQEQVKGSPNIPAENNINTDVLPPADTATDSVTTDTSENAILETAGLTMIGAGGIAGLLTSAVLLFGFGRKKKNESDEITKE